MRLDDYDDFLDRDFDTELNKLYKELDIDNLNLQIELYKPIDYTPCIVLNFFYIYFNLNFFLKTT